MANTENLDWLHRLKSEIYVYMPKEWLIPMDNALDDAIKALEREETVLQALEDVRAEIDTEYKKFRNKSDKWDERANGIGTALEIIDQKIKEIKHE